MGDLWWMDNFVGNLQAVLKNGVKSGAELVKENTSEIEIVETSQG